MPSKLTFSTKSTKHGWTTDHTVLMPATVADSALIRERFGSMERLINRANAQWKVDVATGMREQETPAKARAYADTFCDDGKKTAQAKVVVVDTTAPDAPEYSDEQLEHMRSLGIVVK